MACAYFFSKLGMGSTTTNKTSVQKQGPSGSDLIRSFSLPGFELLDAIAIHHGPILYTTPWSISGDGKAATTRLNGVNLSDRDVFFGSSLRFTLDVDPGKGGFHILYMIWRFQFNKTLDTTVITTLKLTSFRTFQENCTSLFVERQRRRASILPKYLLWQRNHWRVMPTSPLLVWWWSCWALPSTNCPLTQLLFGTWPQKPADFPHKLQGTVRTSETCAFRAASHVDPCPCGVGKKDLNSEVETPMIQATRSTNKNEGGSPCSIRFFGGR